MIKVQITKDLNVRLEKARLTMLDEELKKEEEKVLNDLALKYGDRLGKVMQFMCVVLYISWPLSFYCSNKCIVCRF